jgi:DNA-binding transcriptional ArsR family regulator
MSPPRRNRRPPSGRALRDTAPLFSALGDRTRLALLAHLGQGQSLSITQLTADSPLTRQAITKHLRVLQHAGLVRATRRGRESLFQLHPESLAQARHALDTISRQWDQALARLKAFVEQ